MSDHDISPRHWLRQQFKGQGRRLRNAWLLALTPAIVRSLFEFPIDMDVVPVEVNHLNNQILVQYHADGWDNYTQ